MTKTLLNVTVPSLAGDDFEAFLRRTAGEIIDVAVREVISDLDRIIFDEEISDVTSCFGFCGFFDLARREIKYVPFFTFMRSVYLHFLRSYCEV